MGTIGGDGEGRSDRIGWCSDVARCAPRVEAGTTATSSCPSVTSHSAYVPNGTSWRVVGRRTAGVVARTCGVGGGGGSGRAG